MLNDLQHLREDFLIAYAYLYSPCFMYSPNSFSKLNCKCNTYFWCGRNEPQYLSFWKRRRLATLKKVSHLQWARFSLNFCFVVSLWDSLGSCNFFQLSFGKVVMEIGNELFKAVHFGAIVIKNCSYWKHDWKFEFGEKNTIIYISYFEYKETLMTSAFIEDKIYPSIRWNFKFSYKHLY